MLTSLRCCSQMMTRSSSSVTLIGLSMLSMSTMTLRWWKIISSAQVICKKKTRKLIAFKCDVNMFISWQNSEIILLLSQNIFVTNSKVLDCYFTEIVMSCLPACNITLQIKLLIKEDDDLGVPSYDDIFRDEDEEEGGDSGNESEGSEPSGKRRRFDEVWVEGILSTPLKCTEREAKLTVVTLTLLIILLQGAVERRIERRRARREWEAQRWSVFKEAFAVCVVSWLSHIPEFTELLTFHSCHRREILFDYEQYEYHGTSVSSLFCIYHLQ